MSLKALKGLIKLNKRGFEISIALLQSQFDNSPDPKGLSFPQKQTSAIEIETIRVDTIISNYERNFPCCTLILGSQRER